MSTKRTVGVVVLVGLLTVNLLAANAVVAGHRTVLDPGFVKQSLADGNAYATLHGTVLSGNEAVPIGEDDAGRMPEFARRLAETVVTPAYLRTQVEANVDRAYGYLHGSEDEFVLAVDLVPVKEGVSEAVVAGTRNATVAEMLARLSENDTTALSLPGTTLNASLLLSMEEGPEEYEATRMSFREEVRDRVVAELVNGTYDGLSNDERLALVVEGYDPEEYTAEEKRRLVGEREGEIRAALRERVEAEHGDEIDARVEERLPELRETLRTELAGSVETGIEGADEPAARLLGVFVDGLTTEMTYAEFASELDAAKEELARALGERMEEEVDREAPDRLVLTEEMDPEAERAVESARTAVRLLDALGVALPLVALGLVGLLWRVTRSAETVALGVGVGFLGAGVPSYAAVRWAAGRARELLSTAPPDVGPVATLASAVLGRVVGTVEAQSLALVAVGALSLLLWLAIRAGIVTVPTRG